MKKKSLAAMRGLPLNTHSHTDRKETASQFKLVYGLLMALAIYLETHVAACSWANLLLYYVFHELNH